MESFDEANSFYQSSLAALLRADPLEATTVYLKQAKCLMYLGQWDEACSYAEVAVKQRKELGASDAELAVAYEEVASVFMNCQRMPEVGKGGCRDA